MDGIDLALILGIYGSQAYIYYKIGKIEQKLSDLCKTIKNNLDPKNNSKKRNST